MTLQHRWLIYLLYAGMAVTLSGCHQCCLGGNRTWVMPLPPPLSNGYRIYQVDSLVTLTRPLRIYPVPFWEANAENIGSGLVDIFSMEQFIDFLDGSEYFELPAGTTIALDTFFVRPSGGGKDESYWLEFYVPGVIPEAIQMTYFCGRNHRIAPFPWEIGIEPEEPFEPVDIDELLPGGQWME